MKYFGLASAMVFAAALLAQPAAAADYRGPRHYAKPQPVYEHAHPKRGWTCNAYGNCQPNWGWGKDVAVGPVAMVIVARGEIPLFEPGDRYTNCQVPHRIWNGYRWTKVWDQNC